MSDTKTENRTKVDNSKAFAESEALKKLGYTEAVGGGLPADWVKDSVHKAVILDSAVKLKVNHQYKTVAYTVDSICDDSVSFPFPLNDSLVRKAKQNADLVGTEVEFTIGLIEPTEEEMENGKRPVRFPDKSSYKVEMP